MTSTDAVQQSYKIGAKKNYKLTNTKSKAKQCIFISLRNCSACGVSRIWEKSNGHVLQSPE